MLHTFSLAIILSLAFDDFPWASHFHPRLTTMAQPSHELGRQAMLLLVEAMNRETDSQSSRVTLQAELRIRESTAPPRSARVIKA